MKALLEAMTANDRSELLASFGVSSSARTVSVRMFRPSEAARLMGISTTTLWRLRREGRLESVELRQGSFRITEEAIHQLMERNARHG